MRTLKRQHDLGKDLDGSGAGNTIVSTTTSTTTRVIQHISKWFMWLGSGLLIAIAVLTVSDAFARSFFGLPIQGTIELVELMLACAVFLGMVYTTVGNGHVRVTVLVSRFSRRVQGVLASIITLIGVVLFALLSWQLWLSAVEWARVGRYSVTLNIPVSPFKFVAAVAAGLISLVLLVSFLRSLGKQR